MGEPRKLWIQGPAGRLEAILRVACPARAAAVLAHPHPLGGGTMQHPVVFHSERELHRAGWTTLRFNFRGVGSSEGAHDKGRGELDDLRAALAWLRGVGPAVPLLIVGYSFGSWCAVRLAGEDRTVTGVVAIGLPVREYEFEDLARHLRRPLGVVQGSQDDFGSLDGVRAVLAAASPEGTLYVVDGADHFFTDRAREAAARVVEAAETGLATVSSPR